MDIDEIQNKIKKHLETETKKEINDFSTNLIDLGFVDSFGMIKLITFIETEFKVIADVDAMTEESFTSIKNLAESVLKWKKEQ